MEEVVVVATSARPAVGQATLGQGTLGQMARAGEAPPVPAPATLSGLELRATPLDELTALIKSPEGMRVAMILQEILGTPRCRRSLQQR